MEKLTPEQVVEKLGSMSVMQLLDLTRELEQKWGIKAAPPVGLPCPSVLPSIPESGPSEFSVWLMPAPLDKKMTTIKAIREFLTLGLKEAKELVESAPKVIMEAVPKEEAEEFKNKLTAIGILAEVK